MRRAGLLTLAIALSTCGCDLNDWQQVFAPPNSGSSNRLVLSGYSSDQHELRRRIKNREENHQDASGLKDDLAGIEVRDDLREMMSH